jgi:predicted DNA-binding protein with PD1-like motif
MDYRKYNGTYYIRADKGDEIISCIHKVCEKENIKSAIFSGIGGCKSAVIQTFIPAKGEFESEILNEDMLELVSMNGNIISDENGELAHHAHALFAYKKDGRHCVAGGHLKETTVLYTAEIELRPVTGGVIKKKYSPETGTGFWDFE